MKKRKIVEKGCQNKTIMELYSPLTTQVAKLKASESDTCSESESEPDKGNDKGKQIIDAEPNATVATTKIQKEEPEDPEEEERLFHSQMWVKGSPL